MLLFENRVFGRERKMFHLESHFGTYQNRHKNLNVKSCFSIAFQPEQDWSKKPNR